MFHFIDDRPTVTSSARGGEARAGGARTGGVYVFSMPEIGQENTVELNLPTELAAAVAEVCVCVCTRTRLGESGRERNSVELHSAA
jgi:hypothetical protein